MKFSTFAEYKNYYSRDAMNNHEEAQEDAMDRRTVLGIENRVQLDAMIKQVNRKNWKERNSR